MTPKEKAKELVEGFKKLRDESNLYYVLPIQDDAKQCALICVDEIMTFYKDMQGVGRHKQIILYWQKIIQEINKL